MAGIGFKIGGDASKGLRVLDDFRRRANRVALSVADGFRIRVGQKAFDGLATAASALPGLFVESVKAASDLNEVVSKTGAIFEDQTASIVRWSQDSSRGFGQSRRAALEAASDFGNMFTAMGVGRREAAQMSMRFTELASDLASFSNTSPEDAALALGAALRGESEPIRRYGVLLDDATLKAEAFQQGLSDGKATLSPATKALAAYEVILRQTATAQGDFERTSDGLANSQRTISAQFEDLKATIGQDLTPLVSQLAAELKQVDFQAVAAGVQALIQTGAGLKDLFVGFTTPGWLIRNAGEEVQRSGYNEYLDEMLRLQRQVAPKEVALTAGNAGDIEKALADLEKIRAAMKEGAESAITSAGARGAAEEVESLTKALDVNMRIFDRKAEQLRAISADQLAANAAVEQAAHAERELAAALRRTEVAMEAARKKFRETVDDRELGGTIEEQIATLNRSEEFLRQQLKTAAEGTGEQIGRAVMDAPTYEGQDADMEAARQIVEIERQRADLQAQIDEQQREQAASREAALADYNAEMEMLRAELAGNEQKLAQLQHEQRIRENLARLIAAGVDPADAQARAEAMASLQTAKDDAAKLSEVRQQQDALRFESSIGAVSAMQRIGGGGGFAASGMDYAKQQADLQRQAVQLLEAIAASSRKSLDD